MDEISDNRVYVVVIKNGPIPSYFCLFSSFLYEQIKYKLKKVLMVRLGINPGAAGWKARTSPLSYGSTAC